ncbi:MAG: triose-phosphate isomerase [Candidatus Dadabacteria bacterium RIFCSPHIGHO2_12_FULL_53_21]|nr:MAG: triose-phosphate isomerase [Candidatus Dadabacteria bacterium RIFCSPHIGHO2_12_FULL_53_21]
MRKRLIAGNWKMNMLRGEAGELARGVVERTGGLAEKIDIILAPPFTALDAVGDELRGSRVMLAAQNVFWEERGAFTGEISPGMLADAGCSWVIIGHSERRHILRETDEMVRMKIGASLKAGLRVIVCVGETLGERAEGHTIKAVDAQVVKALTGIDIDDPGDLVIAYEPIWAIGTGHHATPAEAEFVQSAIREIAGNILGDLAARIRIVYGGSVNEENIRDLLAEPDIDGALVGGASLKAESMASIVETAGEQ